jgi:O-glycosyl hydrolase
MIRRTTAFLLPGLLLGFAGAALCQPETTATGNVAGIRLDGQLFEVNSSMCVVRPDWTGTFRGGGQNRFSRDGNIVTVRIQPQAPRPGGPMPPVTQGPGSATGTPLPAAPAAQATPPRPANPPTPGAPMRQPPGPPFTAVESVEDTGAGTAKIDLSYTFPAAADIAGAYLCLQLPSAQYSGGRMQLVDPVAPAVAEVSLAPRNQDQNEYVHATASGVRFITQRRQLEVMFPEPTEVVVRDDRRQNSFDLHVYLGVLSGSATANQTARKVFNVKVAGEVDKAPAEIVVDASRPGQVFAGLGGDFRLQSPRTDPGVIQYNLDNLRVAYARVAMPWRTWHPKEDVDPLVEARAGRIAPDVQAAMEIAKKLSLKGMPVIVSDWSPPSWALVGGAEGNARGGFLDPAKMDHIKESLASYLVFLKEKYGVEAAAFSFNESDIGIDVRQTSREHADLIKTMGPYFASRNLATKLLLGDIGNAYPISFIKDGMEDVDVGKWVYAISFHSWRGCTDENLTAWGAAARALNVPLIVAEGGSDSNAHQYPQIFLEPSFALKEIETYERIVAIAQPKSILHWQLDADYSLLAGGGVYGDNGPLRPTQRFWELKQLSATPPNSFILPAKCDRPGLVCTAFGDIAAGVYSVHVVNSGASRPTTLTGLPAEVKQLRVWVTDGQRGMQEGAPIPVANGKAQFTLDAASYTTLTSAQ